MKLLKPVEELTGSSSESTTKKTSAFDILMNIPRDYLPPLKSPESNNRVKLHNALITILKDCGVGFSRSQPESAIYVVSKLENVFWFLNQFWEKFHERGCHIPHIFEGLNGYRDWKAQKKRKPVLTSVELTANIKVVGDMLLKPWIDDDRHVRIKQELSKLYEAMVKFSEHMFKQASRAADNKTSAKPVRSVKDNWSIRSLPIGPAAQDMQSLKEKVSHSDLYQLISLKDIIPVKKDARKRYIDQLCFPYPTRLMTYSYGNYLGNDYFLWKSDSVVDCEREVSAVNFVLDKLPFYSTRAMKRSFLDKYYNVTKPHVLRNMWLTLTNDQSAAESMEQRIIDDRIVDFFFSCDDEEIITDLRKNNGKLCDPKFEVFWQTLQKELDDKSAVHERRQDLSTYLPDWISVRDLRESILKKCPPGTEAPSESWIRLSFYPSNPFISTAINYRSKFNVKYKVQQKLLRLNHPDSKFCGVQWKYLKHFVFKYRADCHLICVDDKSIIPVGDPNLPVSTNVSRRNRSLVAEDTTLLALDHDYHVAGIVPSILLNIHIPEDPNGSFYRGKLVVSLKDKIFEPSNPKRHSAENLKLLRLETVQQLQRAVNPDIQVANEMGCPIVVCYSDGGPDHNTTFFSVKLANIALFINLNLDMLILTRCAPSQSYTNPAERCMSVLNIPLQGVSLARSEMPIASESKMKRFSTLKAVRKEAETNSILKSNLVESMKDPIDVVMNRFSRTKYCNLSVEVHHGETTKNIDEALDVLSLFVETGEFNYEEMKKKPGNYPKLVDFMAHHCRSRTYNFQIKKCSQENCWYCVLNPVRLAPEVFQGLNWLPDPQMDENKDWQDFDSVYGKETTDHERPAHKPVSANDDKHRKLLVAGKVRGFLICAECGKRRCIFSATRLSPEMELAVQRAQDELIYTCGDSLFPEENRFHNEVIVKEGIHCSDPIQTAYYSGLKGAADICCNCGDDVVLLPTAEGCEDLKFLHTQFGSVQPICSVCWNSGIRPKTRNQRR